MYERSNIQFEKSGPYSLSYLEVDCPLFHFTADFNKIDSKYFNPLENHKDQIVENLVKIIDFKMNY